MKKLTALILALFMVFAFAACKQPTGSGQTAATATPAPEVKAGATVTLIGPAGEIVMAANFVPFQDYDGDGNANIDEVLRAAHAQLNREADYATYESEYGLSMSKLCGDESGAFGYYVNNGFAMSLADAVADKDYVIAYVYQDQTGWSDIYTYFDKVSAKSGDELTLTALSYDADWNLVAAPLEGAVITVDGQTTDMVTDASGKVAVSVSAAGEHVISAVCDGMVLVPAICILTVG